MLILFHQYIFLVVLETLWVKSFHFIGMCFWSDTSLFHFYLTITSFCRLGLFFHLCALTCFMLTAVFGKDLNESQVTETRLVLSNALNINIKHCPLSVLFKCHKCRSDKKDSTKELHMLVFLDRGREGVDWVLSQISWLLNRFESALFLISDIN